MPLEEQAMPPEQAAAHEVRATARFTGPPGREQDAALAWSFELRYYFLRGVGQEPPAVTYAAGVYTCTGTIRTTHPGDRDPANFTRDRPWSLHFCMDADRRSRLREMYADRSGLRFDGRGNQ